MNENNKGLPGETFLFLLLHHLQELAGAPVG
jgi:hypothetical protein